MLNIRVFVTNLQKYTEGNLIGKWLTLPATDEEIATCLKTIGIGKHDWGGNNEEYFLTDWESDTPELCKEMEIGEYTPIESIIKRLNCLNGIDEDMLLAATEAGLTFDEAVDAIKNGEVYFIDGIYDHDSLGRYVIDEFHGGRDTIIPNDMKYYLDFDILERNDIFDEDITFGTADMVDAFDYEAYGRDLELQEFTFVTDGVVWFI